jgi:hypothetical protein
MEKPEEEGTGALTRKEIQQIKAKLRRFIAHGTTKVSRAR